MGLRGVWRKPASASLPHTRVVALLLRLFPPCAASWRSRLPQPAHPRQRFPAAKRHLLSQEPRACASIHTDVT